MDGVGHSREHRRGMGEGSGGRSRFYGYSGATEVREATPTEAESAPVTGHDVEEEHIASSGHDLHRLDGSAHRADLLPQVLRKRVPEGREERTKVFGPRRRWKYKAEALS